MTDAAPPLTTAMVLAAGLGTRMRPLTDDRPKAMVPVLGRPLVDWALDRLAEGGVARAVVNAHHFADTLAGHLATRRAAPEIVLARETELLETGGGTRAALPLLGTAPFAIVNADALWLDGPQGSTVAAMAMAFDPTAMDVLLLVAPRATAYGFPGRGDFHRAPDGRLTRRAADEDADWVFAGVQIVRRQAYDGTPASGPFSNNLVFDAAQAAGRLYGFPHSGALYHIGTPDQHREAEALLRQRFPELAA